MTAPARQPQGIPTGGQFAPDTRSEPTIDLSPAGDKTYTARLTTTVELRNAGFDQLPEWPAGLPAPEVSFSFEGGKCETSITVDDKTMNFWDSDSDGTINDTDNGSNPWEDFDEEDQEKALEWGKRVHQRIDSSTYGIMIEASHRPAVHSIILAHALGKDPAPAPAAPDLTDLATRNAYVIEAEARLAAANKELQSVYMIGAAQELREEFPSIDSFSLVVGDKHLEIKEAWDADGNDLDDDIIDAATQSVFRRRDEDDFTTFTDSGMINIEEAIGFHPGS
jgi:hypothetical protein